jgi:hypothetical protein
MLIAGHDPTEYDRASHDVALIPAYRAMLKAVDPQLDIIWVKPKAKNFADPGRWHVVRWHSNPELTAYWVIQNEDGSYCEPQQRHFDRLMAMDSWCRHRYSDITRARSQEAERKRKRLEETRREFREKLDERLDHVLNGRIAVPGPRHTLELPSGVRVPVARTLTEAAVLGTPYIPRGSNGHP